MTIWYFIAGLFGLIFISFIAHKSLVRLLPYWLYLALLFPGIALHELSHSLVSIFLGVKVERIKIWGSRGGEVIHQKTNPLFQFLISIAPVAVGIFLIGYLNHFLQWKPPEIKIVEFSFQGFFGEFLKSFQTLDLNSANLLILYLMVSLALTLVPSPDDLKASVTGWTGLLVAAGLLSYNQVRVPIEALNLKLIWYVGTILIAIVILSFALNLLKFLSKRLIHV